MTLDTDQAEALTHMAVSHETVLRLEAFVELLLRWQQIKNLVAPSTLNQVWTRHIADSAQLVPLLNNAGSVVDFGSGAGFPGLVLAILMAGRPKFHLHLVESNGRKASFLREAARATGASVSVHAIRIEDFVARWDGKCDFVTARALAPLADLLALGEKLFRSGAQALFLKGKTAADELTEARRLWDIEAQLFPSVTDSTGQIILIRSAARRGR